MSDFADRISVVIVTPAGTQDEYDVTHLRAPGVEGDFGVLSGHLPFMTILRVGAVVLDSDQGRQVWATSGGFVEVLGNQITILAETAERSDRIDLERAESARERALGRLSGRTSDLDIERARLALARSLNRIKIAHGVSGG